MTDVNNITERVIGAAMKVHSALGPGLLESAYQACLEYELQDQGMNFQRQVELPVEYKGIKIDCAYRIDLLVEDLVILELKAVEEVLPVHHAQLLSYLRLAHKEIGLLINFNVTHLRDGIIRKII